MDTNLFGPVEVDVLGIILVPGTTEAENIAYAQNLYQNTGIFLKPKSRGRRKYTLAIGTIDNYHEFGAFFETDLDIHNYEYLKPYIWDILRYSGAYNDLLKINDPIDLIYNLIDLMDLYLQGVQNSDQEIRNIELTIKQILPNFYNSYYQFNYTKARIVYIFLSMLYNLPPIDNYYFPIRHSDSHIEEGKDAYIENLKNTIANIFYEIKEPDKD